MNSRYEQRLSPEELLERNRPEHIRQATQEQTATPTTTEPQVQEHHVVINWTMPESLERIEKQLDALTEQSEWQTEYLRRISTRPGEYPTQIQMDELLKAVKCLEEIAAQAGKKKERHFSLPRFKLPRLHLPEWDGPTVVVALMGVTMLGLLLLWYFSGGDLSRLSTLLP